MRTTVTILTACVLATLAGAALAQTAAPGAMGDPMGSHDAMSASPMSSSATPMASHDAMSASPMSADTHMAKAKKSKAKHQASAKAMPKHP